ncbi:MAG: hypothetical protein V1858_05140 [Candidatus Gottesmanbacteria bacterium]
MIWLLYFCVGVIVLLLSTHALVKLTERLSSDLRISPLIIGTTVVALGTSLPELTVSLIASTRHDLGLALGNIIGSNIVNIFMVLPVGILIGKLRIGSTKTQRNALLLLGATVLFVALRILHLPDLFSGLLLIALALFFTIGEYQLGVFGRTHEDAKAFKKHTNGRLTFGGIASIIFAVAGIILGGILVVSSVENISIITDYSTTILGLSLTAIVTSLPELLTTIFAQKEHQEKITVGNIIGSNMYNLLFIGGVITLFSPPMMVPFRNFMWLIAATLCFVFILRRFSGKPVPKGVGLLLLLSLIVYLLSLVYM